MAQIGKSIYSSEFIEDYCEYCEKFDELAVNLFNGLQLDKLTVEFLGKYEKYLETKFVYKSLRRVKSNSSELMSEDTKILTADFCCDKTDNQNESEHSKLPSARQRALNLIESTDANLLLADLYRRACQSSYLRITFNKSRKRQEDNRLEAVQLGRQAIRFNPNCFTIASWYLISLGWYLDPIVNPRERTQVAQLFKDAAVRSTKMNPQDPLAYHLLGRYYFNVARLSWIELTVARSLLSCKLEGSFEDSERALRRAHELADYWLPTGLWMARVLLAQQKPLEEVKQWIEFGLACDLYEPSTELEREELLELRSKLKIKN